MNIRKKPVRRLKSGIGGHGDLPGEIMDEFKEPDTWTIITALDRILDMAQDSQLSDEFWESVKNPLAVDQRPELRVLHRQNSPGTPRPAQFQGTVRKNFNPISEHAYHRSIQSYPFVMNKSVQKSFVKSLIVKKRYILALRNLPAAVRCL